MRTADYENDSAVSQSQLKILEESPRKYEAIYITRTLSRPPTDAMEFGTLVHGLTLQPSVVASEIAVIPDSALTSNGQRRGKAWDAFCEATEGKLRVFQQDYDRALTISKKVWSHPFYEFIFDRIERVEVPIIWTDPIEPVSCKGIPDIVAEEWVIDLKTTKSLTGFLQGGEQLVSKQIADFGYHLQAAFYLRGASLFYGDPKTRFAFLVVETEEPYRVYAMELKAEAITAGEVKMQRLLAEYVRRMQTGDWSEEGEKSLLQVGIPAWAM
jgi:hypothetical protein